MFIGKQCGGNPASPVVSPGFRPLAANEITAGLLTSGPAFSAGLIEPLLGGDYPADQNPKEHKRVRAALVSFSLFFFFFFFFFFLVCVCVCVCVGFIFVFIVFIKVSQ